MTVGAVFALLTALCWSVAVILFKQSGEGFSPFGLNLFKNTLAFPLLCLTLLVPGVEMTAMNTQQTLVLLASGALGIGIADTLFFAALSRLGAGPVAILECLYSPTVVLVSFLYLGERLSTQDLGGASLILVGVFITATRRGGESVSHGATADGGLTRFGAVVAGLSSVTIMGGAIVWAKPVLEDHDVVWATTVRMAGGLGVQLLWGTISSKGRSQMRAAFTPNKNWARAGVGAFLGTYLSMIFWIAGFKYAPAGVAAVLNQTATIMTVLLAVLFLGEKLDRRRLLAVAAAFGGAMLVVL